MRINPSGEDCRDSMTATVASKIEESTKKCHGRNPSSGFALGRLKPAPTGSGGVWLVGAGFSRPSRFKRPASIEISELIVQPLRQDIVLRHGCGLRRHGVAPSRPLHGGDRNPDRAGGAERVRK